MPSVTYGTKQIDYTFLEKEGLKSHYITVHKDEGVVLKGKAISEEKAQQLIYKKASWILEKLEVVRVFDDSEIVSGARAPYLGRSYYVEVVESPEHEAIEILFNHSKFTVKTPPRLNHQEELEQAFAAFYQEKASEKIVPRVKRWSTKIGLDYKGVTVKPMDSMWGTCTPTNTININTEAVKLPYSLIDYLIVHELVHTKIKNHSKEFWAEVSKHIPNWKELDKRMEGMKL